VLERRRGLAVGRASVLATAAMRAPPTFCAGPRAAARTWAGEWLTRLDQSATAALTPMDPSTASPVDVPICRDAFSIPDAVPDAPAGRRAWPGG
jgi:hypothetical protein